MKGLRVSAISSSNIIISAALFFMLASGAHASELSAKDKLKHPKSGIIGTSNPIRATVNILTGNAAMPGFALAGSIDPIASGVAAGRLSKDQMSMNAYIAPAGNTSAGTAIGSAYSVYAAAPIASSTTIEYTPYVGAPIASSTSVEYVYTPSASGRKGKYAKLSYSVTAKFETQTDRSSLNATSGKSFLEISDSSKAKRQLQTNTDDRPYSFCGGIFKNIFSSVLSDRTKKSKKSALFIADSQSRQESSDQDFMKNMVKDDSNKTLPAAHYNAKEPKSDNKQVRTAAKILVKQAHSVAEKTASSVIEGFYTIKQSLSVAKVAATKHIKTLSNLKNKTQEQTNNLAKGIIPILKLFIANEKLPLCADLFVFDNNTLPAGSSTSRQRDPLPAPARKISADSANTGLFPIGVCGWHTAIPHIDPLYTIGFIDIFKKSAVNYNKTGLSPPQTVSNSSTALLSASNISVCSRSALRVFTFAATSQINKQGIFSFLSNIFIHKTIPLPLLASGELISKGRGFYFNNRLIKGGVS